MRLSVDSFQNHGDCECDHGSHHRDAEDPCHNAGCPDRAGEHLCFRFLLDITVCSFSDSFSIDFQLLDINILLFQQNTGCRQLVLAIGLFAAEAVTEIDVCRPELLPLLKCYQLVAARRYGLPSWGSERT